MRVLAVWRGFSPPQFATVVLTLALVVILAELALQLTALRAPSEPLRPLMMGDPVARSQPAETAVIARLFGAPQETEAADVRLLGVIARGAKGQGVALIAMGGRRGRAARAGEEIDVGVRLIAVNADSVLVSRGGQTEEIRLQIKPAAQGIVRQR